MKGDKTKKGQGPPEQVNKSPLSNPDSVMSNPISEDVFKLQRDLECRQAELELHKAEISSLREELQESRDKNTILYDLAPVGYVTTDIKGAIIEANLTLANLLGYPRDTMLGSELSLFIAPEDLENYRNHCARLKNTLETSIRHCYELQMLRKDGSSLWVELGTVAIRDTKGYLSQFYNTVKEITQPSPINKFQKQTPATEASTDAIIITDKNLNIIFWNMAAEATYGWSIEEVTHEPLASSIRNQVFGSLTSEAVTKDITVNGSWNGEVIVTKKDGNRINVQVSIGVLWDNSGKFNGLVTMHREIGKGLFTESVPQDVDKEIESRVAERTEELLKANQFLQQELDKHKKEVLEAQESEGKNRDLADNIRLGIFRSTPGLNGKFLEVNMAMEEITGYSRDELLSMNICKLFEEGQETNLFTDGIGITNWNQNRECTLIKKSGEKVLVAENIMTIRYDSGVIQYFDGILEDVTERKQAQQQIDQSMQRLQKTIKEIIQAMAYIGEVRDPYTAGHQRRVAQLSLEIGKMVGLSDTQYEGLMMAAFVHDIGKILVPADILSKPGSLTKPEFDMLKDHARIGYEILKTIEFPWPIAKIVLQHHERMNGSGYPSGLNGDQIIQEAKILAVADVVEAMSSHRPYRPALGVDKALAEIDMNKGTLYDTETVEACIKLFHNKGFNLN